MNSLVNDLLRVALGICEDIRGAYPEYGGCEMDKNYLTRQSKTRGLGFFSLDLPNLDSLLLHGLEVGRLPLGGPVSRPVSHKVRVPRFLSGLWLRVFDSSGCLKPDVDTTAIFFIRQLSCLGKRISLMCTTERIEDAVKEYINVERDSRKPTLLWEGDTLDPNGDGPSLHFRDDLVLRSSSLPLFGDDAVEVDDGTNIRSLVERLQRICDSFAAEFNWFEPRLYAEYRNASGLDSGLRHGPGAVSDKRRGQYKFDFHNWPSKLNKMFPSCEFGTIESEPKRFLNHEPPSKLIAVPKTAKTPRLIASEPTSHMYTQQQLKEFMVDVTRNSPIGYFVDFSNQGKSQHLVKSASLDRKLATVDLSMASDRLTCWAVERMFRKAPAFLAYLHATRTRWTSYQLGQERGFFIKKKFASQGTAVTFPVQTVFFLACALAATPGGMRHTLDGNLHKLKGKVRVFGDDIILPTTGYANLVRLLTYLGLKVNATKSFHLGFFRESCGADFYKGDDVTPVKPQRLGCDGPSDRAATIDFSNNLFKKGCWNAAIAAESIAVRGRKCLLPVVGPSDGTMGLFSFTGSDYSHLKKRWNPHLHVDEFFCTTFTAVQKVKMPDGPSTLLHYFTSARYPVLNSRSSLGTVDVMKTRERLHWVRPLLAAIV